MVDHYLLCDGFFLSQIARVFHTHVRGSERVGGHILVFRRDQT